MISTFDFCRALASIEKETKGVDSVWRQFLEKSWKVYEKLLIPHKNNEYLCNATSWKDAQYAFERLRMDECINREDDAPDETRIGNAIDAKIKTSRLLKRIIREVIEETQADGYTLDIHYQVDNGRQLAFFNMLLNEHQRTDKRHMNSIINQVKSLSISVSNS